MPGKRSPVWNYFVRGEEDPNYAKCKLCKNRVKAGDSSTSNLLHHLQVHHRVEYLQIKPAKTANKSAAPSTAPGPLQAAFKRNNPYDAHGDKARKLTEAVTYCIAKDAMPFTTVEKAGFKHMLNEFDPRYTPPSKTQISRQHIPKLFDITRNRVKADLQSMDYFAATTDMWSSHGMTPYMGYTIHHIDRNWKLHSNTLGTRYVPENHTAATLGSAMTEVLEEWGLDPNKQVCITTDNGANILKATRDLEWQQLSCFGHNLHLGITKAFKDDQRASRAIGIAHGIVAQLNYSWKKRRDLAAKQAKDGKPTKTLVSDCKTRWGSTYAMIERIVENTNYLNDLMGEENKTKHLQLKWQDVHVLKALKTALQPLHELTDIMCGDKYVTVSSLKSMYYKLETETLKSSRDDADLVNDIREKVMKELKDKAAGSEDIVNTTSFLDPRMKADYLTTEERDEVKDDLREEMIVMISADDTPTAADDIPGPSTVAPPPPKKQRTLASFLGNRKPSTPANERPKTPREKATRELDNYLSAPSIDIEEDPLDWWRDHVRDFPFVAKLARKYLCIPASSSPSERLFSKAGLIITPKRTQLKPEKANMLIFLAENL